MFCQKCGQQNDNAATLCVKCGAPMVAAGAAQVSASRAAAVGSVYAGFWKRFAAFIIDYLIVVVMAMVAGIMMGAIYGAVSATARGAEGLGAVAGLAVWWAYHAFMESSQKQATLGKMALGIKVTSQNGERLSLGRASGRHFAKVLSSVILAIGFFMAGFTAKKQALHDMIAGCLVVNAGATPAEVQAGVSTRPAMPWWAVVLIVMGVTVVPIGILAAISIPAYQDFTTRAKVNEAMGVGGAARHAVREYYEQNGKLPADLNEARKATEATEQVSPHVRSVTFDPRTGAIRVMMAQSTLEGKSVIYVPQLEKNPIIWKCRSDDVPQRYLPYDCRDTAAKP